MSTSNDPWNGFNVTMSISQSLDDEDLNVAKKTTNIGSPVQCKKIVFSLGENFQPPLAVAFMWDGAELYYNYFKDQRNAKKIYAFNSWKRLPLEEEGFMKTSYVRVLHRLAGNEKELNNNEKKLLMFSIINNIYACLYEDLYYAEDNQTTDGNSLYTFIDSISRSELYYDIHDNVKEDQPCTKAKFVEEMNNFFTKKQEKENKQQNNQDDNDVSNNDNVIEKNNKSGNGQGNGCLNTCTTCLENCWNSIKSCFGGE